MTALADEGLVERLTTRMPSMIDDIKRLVTCESPSSDTAAIQQSASVVAEVGRSVTGIAPERIVIDGRTHLRWGFGAGPTRILILGHHDTVWPIGSLDVLPFSVQEGVLRGPGCFDMKAGLVMGFHALAELSDPTGVAVLVTGDEEIGSPSSRELIEREAEGLDAVLVLEPPGDGGALKTQRKGVSLYELVVSGLAAHAGLEPEKGVNATVELAHQIIEVGSLGDYDAGTTVTPTLLAAGTAANTVPAQGTVSLDVRAWTVDEQHRVDRQLRLAKPTQDGAHLTVLGGINRPPLEGHASADLFVRAAALASRLGLKQITQTKTGGGSDGNFTAGVGTPTLDGLGALGSGAHAGHEHIMLESLPERTALIAALLDDLLRVPDLDGPHNPEEAVRPNSRRQAGRDVN